MIAIAGDEFRPQRFQQAVCQSRRIENRAQQQQATTRIFFARGLDQHIADLRIAGETLGTLQQPDIELAFRRAQIRRQFGVIAIRVIHQKAGMHLEELRQQRARGLRHVRTRAIFDLRKIRLADGRPFGTAFADLFAYGAHQLQLRHGTPETAQRAFDFAQVADFLAELHRGRSSWGRKLVFQIAIIILQFAIMSRNDI